jgi:hypothetical protein
MGRPDVKKLQLNQKLDADPASRDRPWSGLGSRTTFFPAHEIPATEDRILPQL